MRDKDNIERPRRLPHGYCNETIRHESQVVKRFTGPDAPKRAETEANALRAVAAWVPVPALTFATSREISCEYVEGRHGQDILNPETAASILAACGRTLTAIHAVPPQVVFGTANGPGVLVHGDFGPQNLLFDTASLTVNAVLDWEWAHRGRYIEDLAWCEWIVRSHHPDCVDALPHLYYGYGIETPAWPARQAAMLAKCRAMSRFDARRRDGSASEWHRRTAVTAAWRV